MSHPFSGGEDVWLSFKQSKSLVWKYLNQKKHSPDLPLNELKTCLKVLKPNFHKDPKKRDQLKKGITEGINIRGLGFQLLSRELYDECILISDIFNMNELVALDLLCTAETQKPYYPGFGRGLVAVLLYYDSKKALLLALLYLVQGRPGIQWKTAVKVEVARYVAEYTDDLRRSGLFKKIPSILKNIDLTTELNNLQEKLAIGNAQHRRQIIDLIKDIRLILADVLFSWSIQSGLPKEETLILLDYLKDVTMDTEASGVIDDVNLFMLMAFTSAVDLTFLQTREDSDEIVDTLPLLDDTTLITAVTTELVLDDVHWNSIGLKSVAQFALAICLATLRLLPQSYIFQDCLNKEDVVIDTAIEADVFRFMHNSILDNKIIYQERYLLKRMHNLFTDFVIQMYPKVKDLRMRANEVSRTMQIYVAEGLQAPANLPKYFDYLLMSIGKFYANTKMNRELHREWWSSIEVIPHQRTGLDYIESPRSVSLFKFIKLSGDMLPSTLFVPFIKLLVGLSATEQTARFCFNLLKVPGYYFSQTLSWEHFFLSFGKYYAALKKDSGIQPIQMDTIYNHRRSSSGKVHPVEMEGLHAVLQLVRTVTEKDSFTRAAMCENPLWAPLATLLGLVSCPIPVYLKADILETLAILSRFEKNANMMWENVETAQIIVTVPNVSTYSPRGIQSELDEIESKMEEYPLTRGILKLLLSLSEINVPRTLGAGTREPGFYPYLNFIITSIFQRHPHRAYKDPMEKWEVTRLCLTLFDMFLDKYNPQPFDHETSDSKLFLLPPGFHLMVEFNNRTETLNILLEILCGATYLFDSYVSVRGEDKVDDASYLCLKIIDRVLAMQQQFVLVLAASKCNVTMITLSKLLLAINKNTGNPDYCLHIAKYLCYQLYFPRQSLMAVKILNQLLQSHTCHTQFMAMFTIMGKQAQEQIRQGFVKCLDAAMDDQTVPNQTKLEILKLLVTCLRHPDGNFAHMLFGFNIKSIERTQFQYPGVRGFPRTCLHAVLAIIDVKSHNEELSSAIAADDTITVSIEQASYYVFYLLGSNNKSRGPFLRFIRMHKNFFCSQLRHCERTMLKDASHLNRLTWLFKLLAIELKLASVTPLITYLKQLVGFLTNVPDDDESGLNEIFLFRALCVEPRFVGGQPSSHKPPTSDFVAASVFEKQQHYRAMKHEEASKAIIEFGKSWTEVASVLVTSMNEEVLDLKDQQTLNVNLMQCVSEKIVRTGHQLPELSTELSGSVLLMMKNFTMYYGKERKNFNALTYYHSVIKDILNNLMQWIILSGPQDCELRTNIYTALVTFLGLSAVQKKDERKTTTNHQSFDQLFETQINTTKIVSEVILIHQQKIMEIVCQDAMTGADVCRIMAMVMTSAITKLTFGSVWVRYIADRGLIKLCTQMIVNCNTDLEDLLDPSRDDIKLRYMYQTNVSLLLRVAGSNLGAQVLLQYNILGMLNTMTIFKRHPEITVECKQPIHPSTARYLEFFIPILNICNRILTSLGSENRTAVEHILVFLLSHLDVVEQILRSGDVHLAAPSLKELALLTSVISRSANNNLVNIMENPNIINSGRAHLYRIQKLTLNLIGKFLLSENNIGGFSTIKPLLVDGHERLTYILQIAGNALWYSKNVVANHDIEHGEAGVIFYPSLSDPSMHASFSTPTSIHPEPSLGIVVTQLVLTVNHLIQRKQDYNVICRKLTDVSDMTLMDMTEWTTIDLNESNFSHNKDRVTALFEKKKAQMQKEFDYCAFIIENALFLIWAHLDYFMLHVIPHPRHTAINPGSTTSAAISIDVILAPPSDAIWKVSSDVVQGLKTGLISLFNDTFSNQIVESFQDRDENDREFVESLVRMIKRLIQFVRKF